MGKFPPGPILAIILDTPPSCGLIHPPSLVHVHVATGITFLLIKQGNTIHILHRLNIATYYIYIIKVGIIVGM